MSARHHADQHPMETPRTRTSVQSAPIDAARADHCRNKMLKRRVPDQVGVEQLMCLAKSRRAPDSCACHCWLASRLLRCKSHMFSGDVVPNLVHVLGVSESCRSAKSCRHDRKFRRRLTEMTSNILRGRTSPSLTPIASSHLHFSATKFIAGATLC